MTGRKKKRKRADVISLSFFLKKDDKLSASLKKKIGFCFVCGHRTRERQKKQNNFFRQYQQPLILFVCVSERVVNADRNMPVDEHVFVAIYRDMWKRSSKWAQL